MSGILITGGTGLLGPYLADAAAAMGKVTVSGRRGGDVRCDLTDKDSAARLIDATAPDVVFHCAAMTDVDACEDAPEAAFAANRDAVANLVGCLPKGVRLVFFSTDQVYPDVAGPHFEGSEAPVNTYGRSKLAGEQAALAHPDALVLRANFFGPSRTARRSSLSDWVVANLAAKRPIRLFTDSHFSPLHLASVSATALDCVRAGLRGVFNLGCRAGASKCDFALAIARLFGLGTESATPAPSNSVPGRAVRSKDLRMAVGKIEAMLGRPMPTLAEEIAKLRGASA